MLKNVFGALRPSIAMNSPRSSESALKVLTQFVNAACRGFSPIFCFKQHSVHHILHFRKKWWSASMQDMAKFSSMQDIENFELGSWLLFQRLACLQYCKNDNLSLITIWSVYILLTRWTLVCSAVLDATVTS